MKQKYLTGDESNIEKYIKDITIYDLENRKVDITIDEINKLVGIKVKEALKKIVEDMYYGVRNIDTNKYWKKTTTSKDYEDELKKLTDYDIYKIMVSDYFNTILNH